MVKGCRNCTQIGPKGGKKHSPYSITPAPPAWTVHTRAVHGFMVLVPNLDPTIYRNPDSSDWFCDTKCHMIGCLERHDWAGVHVVLFPHRHFNLTHSICIPSTNIKPEKSRSYATSIAIFSHYVTWQLRYLMSFVRIWTDPRTSAAEECKIVRMHLRRFSSAVMLFILKRIIH